MSIDEFIAKWNNKLIDFDGKYAGQCVDLYRQYVNEVLGYPQSPGVTGANEIFNTASSTYYDKIKNTPTGVPNKGDIMIWNKVSSLPYGHVAIFINGNTTSFNSFDQNYPTGSKCHVQSHNYNNVTGWLHPKKGGDMIPADKTNGRFYNADGKALYWIPDPTTANTYFGAGWTKQKPITDIIPPVIKEVEIPVRDPNDIALIASLDESLDECDNLTHNLNGQIVKKDEAISRLQTECVPTIGDALTIIWQKLWDAIKNIKINRKE